MDAYSDTDSSVDDLSNEVVFTRVNAVPYSTAGAVHSSHLVSTGFGPLYPQPSPIMSPGIFHLLETEPIRPIYRIPPPVMVCGSPQWDPVTVLQFNESGDLASTSNAMLLKTANNLPINQLQVSEQVTLIHGRANDIPTETNLSIENASLYVSMENNVIPRHQAMPMEPQHGLEEVNSSVDNQPIFIIDDSIQLEDTSHSEEQPSTDDQNFIELEGLAVENRPQNSEENQGTVLEVTTNNLAVEVQEAMENQRTDFAASTNNQSTELEDTTPSTDATANEPSISTDLQVPLFGLNGESSSGVKAELLALSPRRRRRVCVPQSHPPSKLRKRFSRCRGSQKTLCPSCSKPNCNRCSDCLNRKIRHQACKEKPKQLCISWLQMKRANEEQKIKGQKSTQKRGVEQKEKVRRRRQQTRKSVEGVGTKGIIGDCDNDAVTEHMGLQNENHTTEPVASPIQLHFSDVSSDEISSSQPLPFSQVNSTNFQDDQDPSTSLAIHDPREPPSNLGMASSSTVTSNLPFEYLDDDSTSGDNSELSDEFTSTMPKYLNKAIYSQAMAPKFAKKEPKRLVNSPRRINMNNVLFKKSAGKRLSPRKIAPAKKIAPESCTVYICIDSPESSAAKEEAEVVVLRSSEESTAENGGEVLYQGENSGTPLDE